MSVWKLHVIWNFTEFVASGSACRENRVRSLTKKFRLSSPWSLHGPVDTEEKDQCSVRNRENMKIDYFLHKEYIIVPRYS